MGIAAALARPSGIDQDARSFADREWAVLDNCIDALRSPDWARVADRIRTTQPGQLASPGQPTWMPSPPSLNPQDLHACMLHVRF